MRPIQKLLLSAGFTIALAGCTEDNGETGEVAAVPEPGAETTLPSGDRLAEIVAEAGQVEWRLVSLRDGVLLPDEIVTTIRFEGDEFSGQGPCNRYFGSRNTNPNVPGLFGPVGATRMMCPETQMLYEDQYFEALGGVRDASIEGDRLVLEWEAGDEDGELVFVRVLAAPEQS